MDSGPPLPGTYLPFGGQVPPAANPPRSDFGNILGVSLTIREKVYWKHPEHWYEDGNFGFLVGSAAFRLHGSILSRRSQVMEDLLSLPQPTHPNSPDDDDNIVVDGVPFIKLHDKALDFVNVLNFIYNPSLPGAPAPYLSRQNLMGIIRLTGKYLMDPLRQWAVAKLEAVYLVRAGDIPSKSHSLAQLMLSQQREDHIRTIDFARECSLPQYLSLSFYALATRDEAGHIAPEGLGWLGGFYSSGPPHQGPPPPSQVWGAPPPSQAWGGYAPPPQAWGGYAPPPQAWGPGIPPPLPNQGWPDLPPPPWAQPPSDPPGAATSDRIELSTEDQRRIDEGRVALTKAVIQKAFGMPENLASAEHCSTGSCRKGRPNMWENAALRWEQLLLHPLEELEARGSISYQQLCQSCANDVKNRSLGLRDELVRQLVTFFKLEAEVGPDGAGIDGPYDGSDYGGSYGPHD
ncbi:hypothetical protein FS837_010334 [Tulasnella sp. UAMH 9824]|nr:hypothetical protein FS837_010334 [Tulasnella sp. UAMH 9824]